MTHICHIPMPIYILHLGRIDMLVEYCILIIFEKVISLFTMYLVTYFRSEIVYYILFDTDIV